MKYPNSAELLLIIARTEFKPFTKSDWDIFAGCESAEPRIGYYKDFVIVLDYDKINIIHDEDEFGGQLFELNQLA
jgi:hypothetical protein